MQEILKNKAIQVFGGPVNSPKDCYELSRQISQLTGRKVSPTTLRRFFGLLPSSSAFSTYVLDSISIYIGSGDFNSFCRQQQASDDFTEFEKVEIIDEINQITAYTLHSVFRKSLTDFQHTIPRREFNEQLDGFLESSQCIYPVIAPGGYGKSIALAHWVRIQQEKHVCLFCPATIFTSLLDPKVQAYKSLQFNLSSLGNVIHRFLSDQKLKASRKLLIILDALDELSPDSGKLEELVDFMLNAVGKYASEHRVKIVFSTRESVWHAHLASRFENVKSGICYKYLDSLAESGYTNLFTLSNSEIREIISNVNKSEKTPFIYECIPWNIRELIRIPINLHYISVLFRRGVSMEHITQNAVIREFLRETIFGARYGEQKEDLIWKMLELIEKRKDGVYVHKGDLKKHFPIHLKREKAYYQAFEDLRQNGVLLEYREENKFGIYVSLLGFKHLNFYYYLSALYQIKVNEGLDFELMKRVCNSGRDVALVSNLVASFYQIAYEIEDYATLEHFCELPESVLGSLEVRLAVGSSFRDNNRIRDRTIRQFASHEVGRIFFFERFVDINYLFNNYRFRIEEYLKYAPSAENKLFGHSILYLAGFLQMDASACRHHFSTVEEIPTHENVHPWPIGRKVSCLILHRYFLEHAEIEDLEELIRQYTTEAYAYPDYLKRGLIEFELYIMLALVLVQRFEELETMLSHVFTFYEISNPDLEVSLMLQANQNSLPVYFQEYALFKLGHYDHPELPEIWKGAINSFNSTFDDYQYLIMLHWFLCDYYASHGELDSAMENYLVALELSRFASYDFFTAFLLKNDPSGDKERVAQADQMIAGSGFNAVLFTYQFGSSV